MEKVKSVNDRERTFFEFTKMERGWKPNIFAPNFQRMLFPTRTINSKIKVPPKFLLPHLEAKLDFR